MMKLLKSEIKLVNHEQLNKLLKKAEKALLAVLQMAAGVMKKAIRKLIKSPELQITTVLVLGLLFTGLIVFGMGRGVRQSNMTDNSFMTAYHNQSDINIAEE